jgi:xylulokinase
MDSLFLGIDLGTSGVKVGALNLSSLTLKHVTQRGYSNNPEQDTDELIESTLDALKESVSTIRNKDQIKAIGLSGQMHGAVLYNQAEEIIYPLINWQDRKFSSNRVLEKVKDIIGPAGSEDTGIDMASGLTGAILFGIKEKTPELFARIDKLVLPTDFLRGKLLGRLDHATDQTNAFSTGLFNTRESKWHFRHMRELGLPSEIFPQVHNTTDVAGFLHHDIAERLGLKRRIPIIIGGGDNQMSMLGSGLVSQSSPALINIGTAAQISMVVADYVRIPGVDTRSYYNGVYAFVGASLAGGGSYQWLRDKIQTEKGLDLTFAEMDQLAAQVSPGAEGLVFCPGPSWVEPDRVIGFYGKDQHQESIGHCARAVMEAIVIELYELYCRVQPHNTNEVMVGAGKGLQKSKIWAQIAADIFGKPIWMTNFENALFGAAILAAFGIKTLADINLVPGLICYEQQVTPRLDHVIKYQDEVINHWKAVITPI